MSKEEDAPIPESEIPKGALYQGKPCPHGHSGLRYMRGGACVYCVRRHNDNQERKYTEKWKWKPEKRKHSIAA